MVTVAETKQASNNTDLSLAREISPNKVGNVPTWMPQEPNTYKDFGAKYKQVTRNPINSSRQNKKGVITDLDASGGWQEDLTYEGVQGKIEGLMFAAFRGKHQIAATGASEVGDDYTVTGGGAVFKPGDLVFASGFANAQNNGVKSVTAATANAITVAEPLVDEAGANNAKIVTVGVQAASGELSYTTGNKTLLSTTLDFTTLGLIVGEFLCLCDDNIAHDLGANVGLARIRTIAAHAIVFDKVYVADVDEPMIDAPGTGRAVRLYASRVIKNEKSDKIIQLTYQAERTLGRANNDSQYAQAEYLTGGILNEAQFTFNTADKVTCEWTLLASRYETRTSDVGPKSGNRPLAIESSAFNTSTDARILSLELVGSDVPLYAYVMDLSLTINNNAKPNKAIGVLGAIDMTPGQFTVMAAATAYFANVTAAEAISNNSDCTLTVMFSRDNHGILYDVPLISLGDGRPKVAANEPIQLPLSIDAATAVSVNPDTDYTLMINFFDYLPSKVS